MAPFRTVSRTVTRSAGSEGCKYLKVSAAGGGNDFMPTESAKTAAHAVAATVAGLALAGLVAAYFRTT